MYAFLSGLLADKKGGEIFTLFGGWHFFYIALTLITIVAVLVLLKNKRENVRKTALSRLHRHVCDVLFELS